MNLTGFIWNYIKKQPWKFALCTFLALAWTIDLLFWPYFLNRLVDLLTGNDLNRSSVWPDLKWLLSLGASTLIVCEGAFRWRDFLFARAFPKMEADIRLTLFDHVQHHSPKYFNEHFSGSLANKISDMVLKSSQILRPLIIFYIPSFVTCSMAILIFASLNGYLALIVTGWICSHLFLAWIFTKKCADYSFIHGETRSTLAGKIVDSLANNFAVNLFYRFAYEKKHINVYQEIEQKANQKAETYSIKVFTYQSLAYIIEFFVLVGSFIFFWSKGLISTGTLVQLFYTVWNLSMVIWVVTSIAPELLQSVGIAKQALAVLQDPQDIKDPPNARDLIVKGGEIIFDNVSFRYGEKEVFQNKSVHIEAGEKVGLVGYSGAGKSTFVNLILRFFKLHKGRILIDSQDIAQITLESLRRHIALIPQDPILFHRTLEENIRYGRVDASEKEIIEVAKLAHCDEFIKKCPQGYQTLVGERGTKLSGGEKQRIAIARAMLLNAPILILDEATSALDSVTESYIQDSLEKLMERRTTIVVAHRLSTLAKMDRILVFDRGKIIEEGSHADLISKGGHYAHMWQMQAGGFLPDQPEF